jgi:hypothetical protein
VQGRCEAASLDSRGRGSKRSMLEEVGMGKDKIISEASRRIRVKRGVWLFRIRTWIEVAYETSYICPPTEDIYRIQ